MIKLSNYRATPQGTKVKAGYLVKNDDSGSQLFFFNLSDSTVIPVNSVYIPDTGTEEPAYEGGGGSGASMDFYKCASVNTSDSTWSGYKAVLNQDGYYEFEDYATTGLTYNIKPTINNVYDESCRVRAMLHQAGFVNDTNTIIYIDGSSISNQALSPAAQAVTFGSGVAVSGLGYLSIPGNSNGRITTTGAASGYGGNLPAWTMDFYFIATCDFLAVTGHSDYATDLCLQGAPNNNIEIRSGNMSIGVAYKKNVMIGLSLQYDSGTLHVWNKGHFINSYTKSIGDRTGKTLGIGCDGYSGNYNRMVERLYLFRFSDIARYTPGQDFQIPMSLQ